MDQFYQVICLIKFLQNQKVKIYIQLILCLGNFFISVLPVIKTQTCVQIMTIKSMFCQKLAAPFLLFKFSVAKGLCTLVVCLRLKCQYQRLVALALAILGIETEIGLLLFLWPKVAKASTITCCCCRHYQCLQRDGFVIQLSLLIWSGGTRVQLPFPQVMSFVPSMPAP